MGDGRGAKKTTGAWENSNKGLEPQGKTILKKKIAIDLYASNPVTAVVYYPHHQFS